ncbi:GGDEF domain-containing protein [Sulfurimonas sp. SAG-AH-194-L11]|nr:GGDEF domain-containing protein [Sulfurimonas sp. SAG-AH-194-L11]MDF1876206.1 GGDEF domain-containing protein [Sulfurimonas sp. SAG-AH-194-L11]
MDINKMLKSYFTAGITFSNPISYRRVIVINSMLSLSVLAFFIFTYLNVVITQEYFIALLDFIAALLSLFTLWLLRYDKNVQQAAFISSIFLMAFMIIFITKNQNSHFGLIWSVFIPFFAIMLNGKKLGLAISIFYYTIMFSLAYKGLGIWNDGEWAVIDLLRFYTVSTALTFFIYLTESAHIKADEELSLVRENEHKTLQELTLLSITDALTGVHNRRHFNKVLSQLFLDLSDKKQLLSLLIIDIDYFKEYNDTYGHYAGDIVLKEVAQKLLFLLENKSDSVFRIGGEEFAIIIHNKSQSETKKIIDSINLSIEDLKIEHLQSKLTCKKLTVSAGVCTNYSSKDKQLKYFYKQADDALYEAKDTGRNRTIFSK